jgi:hypothetical protein
MRNFSLVAALALALAAPGLGQSSGIYVIDGGGYSIDVTMNGDTLTVIEPNKTSTYRKQADGSYHFTNPNNGILYGIRIIDDRTIEAFKPGSGNPGTRLSLMGQPRGKKAPDPGPDMPGKAAENDSRPEPSAADVASSKAMHREAERYAALARSDPLNVQSHTACAAVAWKRYTSSASEADAYAEEIKGMLKQLLVDPNDNPCPDVITSW